MFQNMLMTALTPLNKTNEISSWENRPFTTIWPENQQKKAKGKEISRTIKKKPKRVRTAYTTEQLRLLEKTYSQYKYIHSELRKELADKMKIGEKAIKIWFQNRRMKEKRESESSFDSSSESFATVSPPLDYQQNLEVDDKVEFVPPMEFSKDTYTNTFEGQTVTEALYQLPPQIPCPYEYYSQYNMTLNNDVYNTTPMQPNTLFCYDTNVYPTQYYPSGGDYHTHQFSQDGGNNWPSNIFDMGYF